MGSAQGAPLLEVLARARARGFLGPGDVAGHVGHALGFADAAVAVLGSPPARVADLGTGGGVPGLVLAVHWPETELALVESSHRRAEMLRDAVRELALDGRVGVLEGRAEEWAHTEGVREHFEAATARSFARPAVTAEIASGFVSVGGVLVVSDPPDPTRSGERWPAPGLEELGWAPRHEIVARGGHYTCLRKVRPLDPALPRPAGRPAKRPRW